MKKRSLSVLSLDIFRDVINLANGLPKAKIKLKIPDTKFHAWRNRQGQVVVVAGVCL